MGSREELIQRSISSIREVKDMTPGAEMERWLNETYSENSALYRDPARLITIGVEEGWAANQEVGRSELPAQSDHGADSRDVPVQHHRCLHVTAPILAASRTKTITMCCADSITVIRMVSSTWWCP